MGYCSKANDLYNVLMYFDMASLLNVILYLYGTLTIKKTKTWH